MWLQAVLVFVAAVVGLTVLMHIIGAVRYDIHEVIRQLRLRQHPYSRRMRKRPLISAVVLTQNHQASIEKCLHSMLSGAYRKTEIVVIDNASTDATKAIVRRLIAENPKRSLRLVAKRRKGSPAGALLSAYKRYCRGELVTVLSPTARFDRRALARAVVYFNSQPNVAVLLSRTTTLRAPTLTSLVQRYHDFVSYRTRKFASATHSQYLIEGPAIYARKAFSSLLTAHGKRPNLPLSYISLLKLGNKSSCVVYAHDVVSYVQPEPSFDHLCRFSYRLQVARFRAIWTDRQLIYSLDKRYSLFLTWVRLPLALLSGLAAVCVPILITYFVYLALQLQQPAFLIITWLILGILLLFSVWGDGQLRWHQKLGYTLAIPVTYLLFYILSFIQIAIFLRTALRPRSA